MLEYTKPLCVYADCLSQYLANMNCSSLKTNLSALNLCSIFHLWQVQNSLFTIKSLKQWPSMESREGLLCWVGGKKGPISVVPNAQLYLCEVKGTRLGAPVAELEWMSKVVKPHLCGLWTADHGLTGSNFIELSSLSSQKNILGRCACLSFLCSSIFLPPSPCLLGTLMCGCPWKPRVGMTDNGVTVVVFLENKCSLDHCDRDVTWQLTKVVFPLF